MFAYHARHGEEKSPDRRNVNVRITLMRMDCLAAAARARLRHFVRHARVAAV